MGEFIKNYVKNSKKCNKNDEPHANKNDTNIEKLEKINISINYNEIDIPMPKYKSAWKDYHKKRNRGASVNYKIIGNSV